MVRALLVLCFAVTLGFVVVPAVATAGTTAQPPLYPGAVAAARPAGVGLKTPPPQAKTYVTPDDFAKVKAWYKTHLPGAQEAQQPGMEKTEDAFLVGSASSGAVVFIQSYQGKTWIVVGPPM
jgi:hypothetical protein